LPGNWRSSIGWLTALAVAGVFALGIWLHPRPVASLLASASGAGLSRPITFAPSQPKLLVAPVSTSSPTPGVTATSPLAASETPVATAASQAASLASTPAHAIAQPTPVPANDELAEVVTPTPPVEIEGVAARQGGVPILMYHYIRVNPVKSDRAGFILSVTPADFAQQMRLLADNGFHTVTMAQVRAYVRDGKPLPPKPVAVTLDDGYDDAYTAARPILERYHQTATFFIITGFVDHPRYVTWGQVEALDHEGFEIGSHTVHHPSLPRLGAPSLRFELETSRSTLESHLGHPVLDFCYPGGELDQAVLAGVARAGYLAATTTRSAVAQRGQNPLELPRLRVWGGMTLRYFASIVG